MSRIMIEICCGSVDDAVRAFEAGADRIELSSAVFAGGLTPTIGTLREARKRVSIPIICMLRPRAGGFAYSSLDFQAMLSDLRELAESGADGFVVGCLTDSGELDQPRLAELMKVADGKEMVFHRAFDAMSADPIQTLKVLQQLGFIRVLTSGRAKSALKGSRLIREMIEANLIEILPGGGIRPNNLAELVSQTGCDQVHFSHHHIETDTSMQASEISFAGATLKDDQVSVIDAEGLAAFIAQIRGL